MNPILPKHILEGQNIRSTPFARKPMGAGPYRLKSWEPGSRMVLTASPTYFAGKPHIDEVVYRIIPDNATMFMETRAGRLDVMDLSPLQYLRQTSGPVLEKAGDLAALLTNLEPHDVLFIDEIHRLSPMVEEILYPAMEDFQLDIMIGEGPAARSIKLDLPPFTLVGATTRAGLLTSPLRDRFGIVQRLEFYNVDDLAYIVGRAANILNVPMEEGGAYEIAKRSRGTPRIANRLLRRVRDYAQVKGDGRVTPELADRALNMLNVDDQGLDHMDRRLLLAMLEKFDGGPVGVDSLAAAIGEERGTIEDVLEPYLIQQGFLMRTPRGRVATRHTWQYFGMSMPSNAALQEQVSLELFHDTDN